MPIYVVEREIGGLGYSTLLLQVEKAKMATKINRIETQETLEEKKTIKILIGDWDDELVKWLSEVIEGQFGQRYDIHIISTASTHELMELAERTLFDLFILGLNNLIVPDANLPPDDSIANVLKIVHFIKATYRKPIIALVGWSDDPHFAERAKKSGTDYYFKPSVPE